MDKKDLKIVFMGTPEFAVASLDALIEGGYTIVGVITAPDKPAGRGKQLSQSAVKEYALSKKLNILQPQNLKDEDFLEQLRALEPDIQVVVAFRMLPEAVWSMAPLGTFNLHASLLPNYRGAAPINWAIINGEKTTGVTTFLLDRDIDTGKVLMQRKVEIFPIDNAGHLHDKLMQAGKDLVVETVVQLRTGKAVPVPQRMSLDIKPAPKIFKETCRIDWNQPVKQVYDFIRGLSPYPGACAFTGQADGKNAMYKIFASEITNIPSTAKAGEIFCEDRVMFVNCKDCRIQIKEIQAEGKKRMPVSDFLNGFRFEGEERFI